MEDEDVEEYKGAMVDEVFKVYEEEAAFIEARVAANIKTGESWIPDALSFIPWVGSIFEVDEPGAQAALSDVNREARVGIVIKKIEDKLGFSLDAETKNNIREDVNEMYNLR